MTKRAFMRFLIPVILLIFAISVTSCNMQGVTSVSSGAENAALQNAGDGTKAVSETETDTDTETDTVGEARLVDITMEGGSGKAYVISPVEVRKEADGYTATLIWSSENYDYMIVDGQKYLNENQGGASTFTVPVSSLDEPFVFIADTLAMSKPHEIEYTIIWNKEDDIGPGFSASFSEEEVEVPEGLKQTGEIELSYAKGFSVRKYGVYSLVTIHGVGNYLIVPEGEAVPGVGDGITVLKQPFDATYLVSTSAMDLVRGIGSLDMIRFSPLEAEDWDIPEVKSLMDSGNMVYAGKYRTPDYELLVAGGCNLAVENTMIYHDPEVIEKLEELGIPVLVETSSYEPNPLGRLEWIKLYGVLYGREKEAGEIFESIRSRMEAVGEQSDTGKKVACFYVTATGMINVRGSADYMANMIRLAGGDYVPDSDGGRTGSVNMQMEDFYAAAGDADVLIYNGTIDEELGSVDDLIAKNSLFSEFDAVKRGSVYGLREDLFRHPTDVAEFIEEVAMVLRDPAGPDSAKPAGDLKYIYGPVK